SSAIGNKIIEPQASEYKSAMVFIINRLIQRIGSIQDIGTVIGSVYNTTVLIDETCCCKIKFVLTQIEVAAAIDTTMAVYTSAEISIISCFSVLLQDDI